MSDSTPWLSPEQQDAWRAFVQLHQRLEALLARDLQEHANLSVPDFAVLVALSDAQDGKRRIGDLAIDIDWQQSRLSHQLARMIKRGLVTREPCADDGRSAFVVITPRGRDAINCAAPHHVAAVRRLVVDVLTDTELTKLGQLSRRILESLDQD